MVFLFSGASQHSIHHLLIVKCANGVRGGGRNYRATREGKWEYSNPRYTTGQCQMISENCGQRLKDSGKTGNGAGSLGGGGDHGFPRHSSTPTQLAHIPKGRRNGNYGDVNKRHNMGRKARKRIYWRVEREKILSGLWREIGKGRSVSWEIFLSSIIGNTGSNTVSGLVQRQEVGAEGVRWRQLWRGRGERKETACKPVVNAVTPSLPALQIWAGSPASSSKCRICEFLCKKIYLQESFLKSSLKCLKCCLPHE